MARYAPASSRHRNTPAGSAPPRALRFALPAETYGEPMGPLAAQVNLGFREVAPLPGTRPLTDDWAPIEHMVDWELLARKLRPAAATS